MRVVFLAAHLLSPSVASGGDVLFCEIASRIAKRKPEWEIVAVGPDFAGPELRRFFSRVETFKTKAGEGVQGSPMSVALTWFRRLGVASEAIVSLGPDIVHSTGDFFIDVLPVNEARKRARLKWSGVVHHINAPPFRRRNDLLISTVSYAFQRLSFRSLRGADSISVLNGGVQSELEALHFNPERVHVVGAGIDIDRFELAPVTNRTRRAVWLNRLEPTKGLFDLPEILRHLPKDVMIDVVGRGPDVHVSRLRRALQDSGLEGRCVLHGFLHEGELRDVMRRAGVFISCSYEEGWGISIAEALAMGLPCVAYDLPSHKEIFAGSIRRVPLRDAAAFAREITDALQTPESDSERAARRERAKGFSIEECARVQGDIFESLVSPVPARLEDHGGTNA